MIAYLNLADYYSPNEFKGLVMARRADKLIDQISQDVADGVLRPGDQLEEADLASRFGVSRAPIREAVRALVDCGLLETRPRKGAFVRVLSPKELLDLFEVAAELEGLACRLSAASLTEGEANGIRAALDMCRTAADAGDAAQYRNANLAFHDAIHLAADNQALSEQLRKMQMHINAYRAMPYDIRGRLEKSVEEHAEICAAVLSGDGDKASSLMRDHMMLQGKRLPSIIRSMEQHVSSS